MCSRVSSDAEWRGILKVMFNGTVSGITDATVRLGPAGTQ